MSDYRLIRSRRNRGTLPCGVAVPAVLTGVTKDATSDKFVPADATEWSTTLAFAGISSGNPFSLWLMQEGSGSLADSIGSATLNVQSMAYRQSYTGWTRKAMVANDLGGFNDLDTSHSSLPNLNAESCMLMGYIAIEGAGSGDRGVILAGGSLRAVITSGNTPKVLNGTNTATGSQSVTTAVRPWILRHNATASTQALFTDLEKVSVAYAAPGSTKRIFFGAAFETCPNIRIVYGCAFKGAAAELSDAQVRTLLQTLGWTVSW